jgi:hypothetical protein
MKKPRRIPITSRTGDPLQIAQYLYLLPRDILRAHCATHGITISGTKPQVVERLACHLADNGGTLRIDVTIPRP